MAALRLVLVLLWVGFTVSSFVDLQKRIIGGQDCQPNERPYHVRIERSSGGFCGGSLIPNGWILTAAHCWKKTTMNVVLGVNSGSEVKVTISGMPETYKDDQGKFHDLLLVKLPDFAQIPAGVKPIKLPNCADLPRINDEVYIAGQGSTTMGPNNERQPVSIPVPVLQCAAIPVVKCPQYSTVLEHLFCGFNGKVDVCYGDSGGGVVYKNLIYGVIVATGDGQYACKKQAEFIDICHKDYLKWIKKISQPNSNPLKCLNCIG